jgi:hypothetical protein
MSKRQTRKTYTRDDGVLMVEVGPNLFVEESIAERLGAVEVGGITRPE